MNIPYPEIALLVVLTLVNAFFTGSELAFVSLREGQLQRLEESGERGRRIVRLARDPNRFLSTVQVWITLTGFFASAIAAIAISDPLADKLHSSLGPIAQTVSVVIVTLVLAYFTLVFGELAPKRIAMQRAESWAGVASRTIGLCAQVARPLIWVLDRSTNVVVRLTGGDPAMQREEVTEEEIRDLLEAQENFSPDQRSIITGAFEIAERTLREIVVPRGSVLALSVDTSSQEGLHIMAAAGHSRAPVHTGDLDDVLGIVHLRDLLDDHGLVRDQARPATVLPESLGVLDALRRLQTARQQMAIVVNEHGGVEGIITVEDLLEEIVGEIYDEFDRDISELKKADDGSFELPGSFPIHDLPDLGIELPDGEGAYATIAGFVLDRLGRIPDVGDSVTHEKWRVEVVTVSDRAIIRVRLRPIQDTQPAPEA